MLFTCIGWGVAFALALFCALLALVSSLVLGRDYEIVNGWGWAFCLAMMMTPLAGIQFGKAFDDYCAYKTYPMKAQALKQYKTDATCRACCCDAPTCDKAKQE